jgi:hypothetical protein
MENPEVLPGGLERHEVIRIPPEHSQMRVSFDVGLGKQLSYMDFDVDAYTQYLQDRQVDQADINRLSVNVSRAGLYTTAGYRGGHIEVWMGKFAKSAVVDKAIYHESEHFIDDMRGMRGKYVNYWIGANVSLRAAGASGIVAATALYAGGELADVPVLNETVAPPTFVMAGILLLGGTALYRLSPPERRAHRAAAAEHVPMVSIEK